MELKDGECAICLSDLQKPTLQEGAGKSNIMTNNMVIMTPCGHHFHKICCETWIKMQRREGRQGTCPMCRADVRLTSRGVGGDGDEEPRLPPRSRYVTERGANGASGGRSRATAALITASAALAAYCFYVFRR